jgi:hypothetical protein
MIHPKMDMLCLIFSASAGAGVFLFKDLLMNDIHTHISIVFVRYTYIRVTNERKLSLQATRHYVHVHLHLRLFENASFAGTIKKNADLLNCSFSRLNLMTDPNLFKKKERKSNYPPEAYRYIYFSLVCSTYKSAILILYKLNL